MLVLHESCSCMGLQLRCSACSQEPLLLQASWKYILIYMLMSWRVCKECMRTPGHRSEQGFLLQ